MYRTLILLGFILVAVSSSDSALAQTNNKTTQPPISTNAKSPSGSSPIVTPASTNSVAKGLYNEGLKLIEAELFSRAAETFQQVLKLDPEYADAYEGLGRAYFKMRQWQKAIDNFRRAAQINTKLREEQEALHKTILMKKAEPAGNRSSNAIPPGSQPKLQVTNHVNPVVKIISTAPTTARQGKETDQVPRPSTTPQPEPNALKESDSTKKIQTPVGAEVSMNAIPASPRVDPAPASAPSAEEISLTKVYRVGPSDVLDVRLNDPSSPKSTLFTITPSGLLEHPMLAEPLTVTGLTVEEIGAKIESDLSKRALIENPKVAVGVRDYASHTILVSGLVKDSGTKMLRREAIPLYVVVADAQPLPEAARVTVVRNELNQTYEIDLTNSAGMNLLVRPGDVITLHPNVTQFVYIGGEVKFPGEKTFRRGLTLTQAIITAGVTSKSKVAQIGRDDGRGFLIATRFILKDIESGKAMDPPLRPGDRIVILH